MHSIQIKMQLYIRSKKGSPVDPLFSIVFYVTRPRMTSKPPLLDPKNLWTTFSISNFLLQAAAGAVQEHPAYFCFLLLLLLLVQYDLQGHFIIFFPYLRVCMGAWHSLVCSVLICQSLFSFFSSVCGRKTLCETLQKPMKQRSYMVAVCLTRFCLGLVLFSTYLVILS